VWPAQSTVTRVHAGPVDDVVCFDHRAMWEPRVYLGTQLRERWACRTLDEPCCRPYRRQTDPVAAGGARFEGLRLSVVVPFNEESPMASTVLSELRACLPRAARSGCRVGP
jgi:hypothetical protein